MALFVKFYSRPVYQEFESDKQGRPIHLMRDFVRIEIPGIVANVIDTYATEDHKYAHAVEWARYLQEKESGIINEHEGTMLSSWPQLNAAQVLELRHFKFYTVEQIADAGDMHLQAIGMCAGMAPTSLRDKARAWLDAAISRNDTDASDKRDAEIAELKSQLASVMSQIKPKNKGGRPRKQPEMQA